MVTPTEPIYRALCLGSLLIALSVHRGSQVGRSCDRTTSGLSTDMGELRRAPGVEGWATAVRSRCLRMRVVDLDGEVVDLHGCGRLRLQRRRGRRRGLFLLRSEEWFEENTTAVFAGIIRGRLQLDLGGCRRVFDRRWC